MSRRGPWLSGWSRPQASDRDWRRRRDWTGWHTTLAALVGVALPLTLGILTGVFDVGPDVEDLSGDLIALEENYREVWTEALVRNRELGYAERLQELVFEDGRDDLAPWATGFREGWEDGRRDAAEAMRKAVIEQGLAETRVEWRILERLP